MLEQTMDDIRSTKMDAASAEVQNVQGPVTDGRVLGSAAGDMSGRTR